MNKFDELRGHWREINKLQQLDCLIAQGNHLFVRATMSYITLAQPGKYKSEISLHQSYHSSYKLQQGSSRTTCLACFRDQILLQSL